MPMYFSTIRRAKERAERWVGWVGGRGFDQFLAAHEIVGVGW